MSRPLNRRIEGRAMADPLNDVYKARQSPRFAASRRSSDARPGRANSALKAQVEPITTGLKAIRQDPRNRRPEEAGSGLAPAHEAARDIVGVIEDFTVIVIKST